MSPPGRLGRGVVVDAGQEIPVGWRGVERLELDEASMAQPAPLVERLHRAWVGRVPIAVSLGVDPARFRHPPAVRAEPWTLGARFELWEDRLQFLVWANNYDARGGPPVWWWARKAMRLGASEAGAAPGDVVLPDGRPAWIDGGPRGGLPERVDGAVLVHREAVERGRLTVERAEPPVSEIVGARRYHPATDRPAPATDRSAPDPSTPDHGAPDHGAPDHGAPVQLAPDQLAAVSHPSGPARIIAPAGSGKTRVLTARLRHLLEGREWDRDAVLAVAYNKKAQEELDARCAGLGLRTRTLNSLGLWLLTLSRGRAPRVLEERETRRLVETLAPIRRQRANTDPIGPYVEGLAAIRLGLRDPEVVEASRDDVPGLTELFPRYREQLAELEAVDFDEQIYGAIEALLSDGVFRLEAQRSGRHLLVDEFQDLTPAHVLLLRLLSLPALDVFGVGDDDQVIYGHAGADPAFLIDYDRLFPGAASHPLEVNYRCPPAVVAAAVHLLSYNQRRVDKVIRAGKADRPAPDSPGATAGTPGLGGPALQVRRHDPTAGAETLVGVVLDWLDSGVAPAEITVLTRVNSLLLAPQVALGEARVPLNSVLRPDVLDRTGLRAALAYLRIAAADDRSIDSRDLVEILRRPSRGLPPWFPDRLRRRRAWSVEALLQMAGTVPDKDATRVERLVDDVVAVRAVARASSTDRVIRAIRDEIGLGAAMSLLDESRGAEGSSHIDDLEALEQVAALHPDPASFEPWLRSSFGAAADAGGVVLSTVHRVKGMEWERVAVYGVTAGIMPHRLAEDVEEERRVLHVAITRAREQVAVLADRNRPSPFLSELAGTAPRRNRLTGHGGGEARPPKSTDRKPMLPAGAAPTGRRNGARGGTRPDDELSPEAAALAERLRTWRRERAKADNVPPYVVFADRTLRSIATRRPATLKALLAVDGIGPTKLELYGEDILAIVAG